MIDILRHVAIFFFAVGIVFLIGGNRMDYKPLIEKGAILLVLSFILHYINYLVG